MRNAVLIKNLIKSTSLRPFPLEIQSITMFSGTHDKISGSVFALFHYVRRKTWLYHS
jgi:hypothetical protein